MKNTHPQNIKKQEIIQRQNEVAQLHIRGVSITEIAKTYNVDERTINRDIQEIRKKRLQMFENNEEAKKWVRNELADTMCYLDEMKNVFYQQSINFISESAKTKALWYSVQTANLKANTVKSLMQLIFDIQVATSQLTPNSQHADEN